MKNISKILFFSFLFLITLFVSEVATVSAKSSSSEVFEVVVGEDKVPVYYTLVLEDTKVLSNNTEVGSMKNNVINMNDGSVFTIDGSNIYDSTSEKVGYLSTFYGESVLVINNSVFYLEEVIEERMNFSVVLKGLDSESESYRWEHQLCYKIKDKQEVCEVDLTGEDQVVEGEESIKILSNTSYSYTYFDEDMPYYSESLEFEYITFKNKFVSLKDGSEIILNDISFLANEIDYSYQFDAVAQTYEKEGIEYVGYNPSGILVNYYTSDYALSKPQGYAIISEMCVEGEECIKYSYNSYSSGLITPYLPNLRFYYEDSSKFKGVNASTVTLRTYVACITNCSDTRRAKGTIEEPFKIHEDVYNLYMANPEFDESNSLIDSMSEYKKNENFKISVKDEFTGINDSYLYVYVASETKDGSCPVSIDAYSKYKYSNGVSFNIGEGNSGNYCMYFEAANVMGNIYKSKYYHLKFDNESPTVSSNHMYESDAYYNEVVLNPILKDTYSGVKESYYLWSQETITTSTYLKIKTEGKLYEGVISSREDLIADGTYNLYFLIYDNLDNYNAYRLGIFNIDTTPLSVGDVIVSSDLDDDNYNNNGGIVVNVSEMNSSETYKCAFLNSGDVTVLDLTMNCMNGNKISLPSYLEGEYSFYAYVRDKANNYSLLKLKDGVKIDTKSPVVTYSVLYDDNEYRVNNQITINVSDYSDLNSNNMKYGWFAASKSNVVSSSLVNSFENNGDIYYPSSYYGEYKLYISVMDNVGNETFMALDKIFKIDTDIVRISLVGDSEVTILRGEEYIDLGAKAYKGQVGSSSRVSEIRISGEVDTSKAGVYYMVYSSGEGEFEVNVTRKIIVKNDIPYLFITLGLLGLSLLVTSLRLFVRRKNNQNI